MCLAICSILGPQCLLGASRRRSDDVDAFTLLFLNGHKKMFGLEFEFGFQFGFLFGFQFGFKFGFEFGLKFGFEF